MSSPLTPISYGEWGYYPNAVFANLQIVVASIQLTKKEKLERKYALESKLCKLKRRNGGIRMELQRASAQLSQCHRELLGAQSRSKTASSSQPRSAGMMPSIVTS